MKKHDTLAIGIIVAAYLALASAYSVVIPPFEGLDEAEHFGVVRYVADTGRLPVQGDETLAAYDVRQEASQPPLYYLATAPALNLSRISTADTLAHLIPNPYVTCGAEAIRADKATLRHDPFAEAFPWRDTLLALHLLRVLSVVFQALTVVGVYAIARRVFPHRTGVPVLAAALTTFNPQFLVVASSINNDNIATPVVTWAVYVIVLVIQSGLSLRRALTLGVLIGLAMLSKLTGALLLPFVFLAWGVSRGRNKSEIRNLAILGGAALLVAGWWYIRNWQLYGDLTGLSPMLRIVGQRGPAPLGLLLSELGLVFRSYWGQLPCAFLDSTIYYLACALVVALGLTGAVWGLLHENRDTVVRAVCLAIWSALVLIGWFRWNLMTPAPGGRLLFTSVGATSTLLAYGLTGFLPRRAARAVPYICASAMAAVGLAALLLWIRPLFAPPPMMDAARDRPQHPLSAQFGDSIVLLGYDLRADALGPGRYIDVTLHWRALQPIPADYTLALQLVALAPGDTRTLLNFNTWPGGGNLPTFAWPVGPIILDHYRLPLPSDTGVTQAWRFQAILYDASSGTRLPLTLDARPAGEALTLDRFRIRGASIAALPDAARLAAPVTFDQRVALTHAQVDAQSNGVRVRLLWKSLSPLPHDVTVFVHAYDASGKLAATGDGPPMGGNLPTSFWQMGDQVLDEHVLVLPRTLSLADVQIKVGLYRPEDRTRLAAIPDHSTARLPEDALVIWPN